MARKTKFAVEPKIIVLILATIIAIFAGVISFLTLTSYFDHNIILGFIYLLLPSLLILPACKILGVHVSKPQIRKNVVLNIFLATIITDLLILIGIFGVGMSVHGPFVLLPIAFIYTPVSLIALWSLTYFSIFKPSINAYKRIALTGAGILVGAVMLIYFAIWIF